VPAKTGTSQLYEVSGGEKRARGNLHVLTLPRSRQDDEPPFETPEGEKQGFRFSLSCCGGEGEKRGGFVQSMQTGGRKEGGGEKGKQRAVRSTKEKKKKGRGRRKATMCYLPATKKKKEIGFASPQSRKKKIDVLPENNHLFVDLGKRERGPGEISHAPPDDAGEKKKKRT